MIALRHPHKRDPKREHLLHDGAAVVELVFHCADQWLKWRRMETKIAITRASSSASPSETKPGGFKMFQGLPKFAFFCVALAFAAAAPVGAQGARDVAMTNQASWCLEKPFFVASQDSQNGVDLEPQA